MPEILDAPVPPAPEKASLFEDLIDIVFSPAKVFARRAGSGFGAPMLVVAVLIGVLFFFNARGAMSGIFEVQFQRGIAEAMAQNPNLTPDMAEKGRGIGLIVMVLIGFASIPIAVLCVGLVTWGVARALGAEFGYRAAAMIVAYAYVPKVIDQIVIALQGVVLDTSGLRGLFQLSLGVGRFLDPETTSLGMQQLLGRIDVFTIWVTLLIGLGISVVGRVPRAKAMAASVVIWAAGAIPAVWTLVKG